MSRGPLSSQQARNDNTYSETSPIVSRSEMAQISNDATSPFIYDQLDESIDSIRLLSFEEGCDGDDIIQCKLVHMTFREKPVYDALSYTWGQATAKLHTIFINGKPFAVRDNLFHALKSLASQPLRHNEKGQTSRLLWIDAICINQSDLHERSKQVGIMDFIYTRASYVLVWLASKLPAGIPIVGLRYEYDKLRLFQKWIVSNPYWSRLWIIQEFVLATRLKICVGHNMWTLSEFLGLMAYLITGRFISENLNRSPLLNIIKQREESHTQSNRLEFLVEKFQHAKCQDMRDRIFGFLGLANDCHDGSLQADYTKPMCEIFADVLKHFCRSGNLESNELNIMDRQTHLIRYSHFICTLIGGDNWQILKGGWSSKDEVQVRGAHCGKILHLGPTYEDMISSAAANRRWIASFDKLYTSPNENAKLRLTNEVYNSIMLNEIDREKLARVRAFRSQPCYAQATPSWAFLFRNKNDWTYRESANSSISDQSESSAMNTCTSPQPRIFLGSNLLLGLAPGEAQEGDIICRFVKTNITALLRREGYLGAYRLIGRIELTPLPLLKDLKCRSIWEIEDQEHQIGLPNGTEFILNLDLETLFLLIS